jgi:hypothetical protein
VVAVFQMVDSQEVAEDLVVEEQAVAGDSFSIKKVNNE